MLHRRFKISHIALAIACISNAAIAQEATVAQPVETIDVKGQRLNGVKLVDLTDIRKKQANDLEDIFRDQPNVTVGGSFGIAQKIYVRGIEDTNLNVSIDGATQSGYIFHHQGRLSIEPELIKQVEVKAGAGTALDGAGALGGAIRFETKNPEDLLQNDEKFGALIKTGYFSNTDGYKASINLYGQLTDDWSALAVLGKNKNDEIEDGNGAVLGNTKTEQELGLLKIVGNLSDSQQLVLSHDRRNDDGRRNIRPHFLDAPWNGVTNQRSRRETSTVNYRFDPTTNQLVKLHVTGYFTDSYITQTDSSFDDGAGVKSYGLDVRNTSSLADHEITYGIDYRNDKGYYINPTVEEVSKVVGVYIQDHFEVSDALSLSYGLRYDNYSLDDADQQRYSANGFSPNINAVYQIDDNFSLRSGFSQALRGQQVKEAYLIGFRKNAPDLTEEKAQNIELALDYRNDDGLLASVEVFKSDVDDVVGTTGTRETGRFFGNAGDLETTGYNLMLAKNWENGSIKANYSHTKPEIDGMPLDDGSLSIGTSFGNTLILSASYQLPQYDLELSWTGRFVETLDDVPTGYPNKPSFNTQDIAVEWFPLSTDQVSVNLTVSNLFDEFYHDHGTFGYSPDDQEVIGLPEPGRDIRLTIGWAF